MKDDWDDCKMYVMDALKRIEGKLDGYIDKQDKRIRELETMTQDNRREISVIRTQVILFGTVAAIVTSFVFQLVIVYLK